MNTTKKLRFPLTAIFFLLSTVFRFIDLLRQYSPVFLSTLSSWLLCLGFVALATLLFLKKRGLPAAAICASLTLPHILLAIVELGFMIDSHFYFFGLLRSTFYLLEAVVWLCLGSMFLPSNSNFAWLQEKNALSKFLPIAYSIILVFRIADTIGSIYHEWQLLLYYALLLVAIWLFYAWQRDPYEKEELEENSTLSEQERIERRMRRYRVSIVKHVLLLLFTPRVWLYIWTHKVTRFLNFTPNEERRSPTICLLLCIFVPFYRLYWIYKSAQRVDNLGEARGIHSHFATTALVLGIFFPILGNILMQDKINAVIRTPLSSPINAPTIPVGAEDLQRWKRLLDEGAITEEEYAAKKKQILFP